MSKAITEIKAIKDLTNTLPITYDVSEGIRFSSIMASELVEAFLSGSHPYFFSYSDATDMNVDWQKLLPEDAVVGRRETNTETEQIIVHGHGYIMRLHVYGGRNITVWLVSTSHDRGKQVTEDLFELVPTAPPRETAVSLDLWVNGMGGPRSRRKRIETPSWEELQPNYPDKVAKALGKMMGMDAPSVDSGKIILWYGDPGTGKTTALRSMAREWRDWCSVHYITDPEQFFTDPAYLMTVAGGNDDDPEDFINDEGQWETEQPRWKLVVCEDSDQYLRPPTHSSDPRQAGALGRLLNYSDGILGQGSRTLFLITTNVEVNKLHPAVIRPGRCLAQFQFGKFSIEETNRWLNNNGLSPVGSKSLTLAELIELRNEKSVITVEEDKESVGQYL